MKNKWFLGIFLLTLLVILLFAGIDSYLKTNSKTAPVDVFVGVDAAYDGVQDVKNRIDQVKSYTNFFVIGSTGITFNETRLNDVCQYLNDSGLNFMVYTHALPNSTWQAQWVKEARQRWSAHFVGLYAYDEPGGIQVDRYEYDNMSFMLVQEASNYTDAANKYVENLTAILNEFRVGWNVGDFPLVTSDYALYDYDYRGGYDVVLAEFAWNHSRELNVALCRGAATVQNKDWGVMITYTQNTPPYLESGPELYNDMVTAYQNGAKYIVVFDYAKDQARDVSYGILQPEHLDALKQFWQYVKDHPRTSDPVDDRVAYVLPKDYGFGFRGPIDKIWGLWEADNLTGRMCNDVNSLLAQYNWKVDIIYEDQIGQNSAATYQKLIFWNGTVLTRNNN
jgi:uncharacterized protein (UPF0333 family)